MGEKSSLEDEDDEMEVDEADEEIGLRKIVNFGRMYGQLVADDAIALTALKVSNPFVLKSIHECCLFQSKIMP